MAFQHQAQCKHNLPNILLKQHFMTVKASCELLGDNLIETVFMCLGIHTLETTFLVLEPLLGYL